MDLPNYILKVNNFNSQLSGRIIKKLIVNKDDYLNISYIKFKENVENVNIVNIKAYGKWIFILLSNGKNIMINPGISGDIFLCDNYKKIDKISNIISIIIDDSILLKSEMKLFGKFYLSSDDDIVKNNKVKFKLNKIMPNTAISYINKHNFNKLK